MEDTIINEIFNFLKTTIGGLIILGAFGSILGVLTILLAKKLYFSLANRYKILQTQYYHKIYVENYYEGYISGYAALSDIHQTALIGRFIVNIIIHVTVLIILSIIVLGFFSFLPFELIWIMVFVVGILIVFPIRKIKKNIKYFYVIFDNLYNEDEIKEKADKHREKKVKSKTANN